MRHAVLRFISNPTSNLCQLLFLILISVNAIADDIADVHISTGGYHTIMSNKNWAWVILPMNSNNFIGGITMSPEKNYSYVEFDLGDSMVNAVDAGSFNVMIQTDNSIYTYGDRDTAIRQVNFSADIISMSASNYMYSAVTSDNHIWEWKQGQVPEAIDAPGINIQSIKKNFLLTIILDTDGRVWKKGQFYPDEPGGADTYTEIHFQNPIVDFDLGRCHIIAMDINGSVWTVGDNTWGALGDGTYNNSSEPIHIDIQNAVSVSAGHDMHSSMVLTDDGTVWAWGTVLGSTHNTPQKVFSDAALLSAGITSTFIKSDGSVWQLHYSETAPECLKKRDGSVLKTNDILPDGSNSPDISDNTPDENNQATSGSGGSSSSGGCFIDNSLNEKFPFISKTRTRDDNVLRSMHSLVFDKIGFWRLWFSFAAVIILYHIIRYSRAMSIPTLNDYMQMNKNKNWS